MKLFSLDPCRAYWEEALRLPPKSLSESLLWELGTYYGLSRQEVIDRCRTGTRRIAEAWRTVAPQTPEAVEAFYRQPLDYAFELLWWHSFLARSRTFLNLLPAMRWAANAGARQTLDFGGGVGSHAIVMAASGFDVALADVSEELLAFAKWRAEVRARAIRLLHLDREPLEGDYEFIVAVDVLEHLPAPAQALGWLCDHLHEGGLLFISMPTKPSPDLPQHISFWGDQLAVEDGLQELMRWGGMAFSILFRKTGRVRLRGGHPRYAQPGPVVPRVALLPAIFPGLWWAQTWKWLHVPRATQSR